MEQKKRLCSLYIVMTFRSAIGSAKKRENFPFLFLFFHQTTKMGKVSGPCFSPFAPPVNEERMGEFKDHKLEALSTFLQHHKWNVGINCFELNVGNNNSMF